MRTTIFAVAALASLWPADLRAADIVGCYASRGIMVGVAKTEAYDAAHAMDPTHVRRYVKRNLPKLEYCYAKQKTVDATLQGAEVAIQLQIREDGTVAQTHVEGFDETVDTCIEGVLAAIQFPKPPAINVARLTLDFRAGQVFDVLAPSCTAVPAKVRALGEQLARAIDAGDTKTFAKLLPSKLERGKQKLKKAKVKAAVAKAGIAAWLELSEGGWYLLPSGKQYVLYRDDETSPDYVALTLRRSGKKWVLRGVTRITREVE